MRRAIAHRRNVELAVSKMRRAIAHRKARNTCKMASFPIPQVSRVGLPGRGI